MYKLASRNLQRRYAVDKPLPTGGYIGTDAPADLLPDPATMGVDSLRAELFQLRSELIQLEQQLAVAKTIGDDNAKASSGQRKSVLCARLSAVKKALSIADATGEMTCLQRAVRETLDDETANRVFARARELRTDPSPFPVCSRGVL